MCFRGEKKMVEDVSINVNYGTVKTECVSVYVQNCIPA